MDDDAMALVAVAPVTVDDALIVSRLRELLAVADLQCTTERQLRQMLEEELGVSLAEKKAFIREQVEKVLMEPATEAAAAEGGASSKKRKSQGWPMQTLSAELAEFMGSKEARRSEVVKRLWEHIKANNLMSGKTIACDAVLKKIFNREKTDMLKMNQLLSPHIKTKAELTSPSSGTAPKKAKKSPSAPKEKKQKEKSAATTALAAVADPMDPFGRAVKKRAKAVKAPKDPNAPKGATPAYGFFLIAERVRVLQEQPGLKFAEVAKEIGRRWSLLTPADKAPYVALAAADKARAAAAKASYVAVAPEPGAAAARRRSGLDIVGDLSPELAAFLHRPRCNRADAVSLFWAYVKDKGLQDPADRRYILADDTLKALFGEDRFLGFHFTKFIQRHFTKPQGGAAGEAEEEEAEEEAAAEEEEEEDDAEE